MNEVRIGNRVVGPDQPCLVVVDAGVNHNNSVERGIELVGQAAAAGAEVVKFQTYRAHTLATRTAPRYWDPKLDRDGGGSQYDTFVRLDKMEVDGYRAIKHACCEQGVLFSSTPFNLPDIQTLEIIGLDVYKISSSDITYLELIRETARAGKPLIISTGCATICEIERALEAARSAGNEQIILQHCVLQYPCDDANANLVKMCQIQKVFPEIPVGYSDHTRGTIVAAAAVAMGARTIEKHFTVDKNLPNSPDHSLSADPSDLKELVTSMRRIEAARGTFIDGYYPAEKNAWKFARKSLVATRFIPQGTVITAEILTCKRPGTGFQPEQIGCVVGQTAKTDIFEDTTLMPEMVTTSATDTP